MIDKNQKALNRTVLLTFLSTFIIIMCVSTAIWDTVAYHEAHNIKDSTIWLLTIFIPLGFLGSIFFWAKIFGYKPET